MIVLRFCRTNILTTDERRRVSCSIELPTHIGYALLTEHVSCAFVWFSIHSGPFVGKSALPFSRFVHIWFTFLDASVAGRCHPGVEEGDGLPGGAVVNS